MKIKTKWVSYEYTQQLPPPPKEKLGRPSFLFRLLIRILSAFELRKTKFTYTKIRMNEAGKGPYLILMNHSSFIDLKIASKLFFPKSYYIVCTTDGFVGKKWLMRRIGCIPTRKFITDVTLTRNMIRAVNKKKRSVLLFPEAGYSLDGLTTVIPKSLASLIKKMNVPVVSVITDGAFLRQPLYNNLHLRKTKVSAQMKCLLTKAEIAEKSTDEIFAALNEEFAFDNFRNQVNNSVKIEEENRADGLNRILYRCPACQTEGKMRGEGIRLVCEHCQKSYIMDEYGQMHAENSETEFTHIPDWTAWERECVRKELENGSYRMELDVDIGIIADYKAMYMVGDGKLVHTNNGFELVGCDGKLNYTQSPLSSYCLNSDFYWYEIGDVIGIGDNKRLYYCFPKQKDVVMKARFATEELYKMLKNND